MVENSDKPCDVGTPVADLAPSFPEFSFEEVDPIYPAKTGRYAFSETAIVKRGAECRVWLRARPEKVIAVVSHSGFLRVGVSNCGFGNADYRIFDFAPDDEEDREDRLVEWPLTQQSGGGLGRSMKGWFGVESQPWPEEQQQQQHQEADGGVGNAAMENAATENAVTDNAVTNNAADQIKMPDEVVPEKP